MVGPDGTGDAVDGSDAAPNFLGRPLDRLMPSIDAEAGWVGVASVGADAGSFIVSASGDATCRTILAANASSTRLASSVDRRFLAFRIAIARGCKPSPGRLSISRISSALHAADSSAPSFTRFDGMFPFPVWSLL